MAKTSLTSKTNIETLIQYTIKNNVVLNDDQIELMQRIQYADEKKRGRTMDREQIIHSIITRFGVSKWRADQDITDAHALFGSTRKLNKNYLLAIHIDDIEKQIKLAEKAIMLHLLPKLNDNLTYALNSLPPDVLEAQSSPTTIIFIVKPADGKKKRTIEEILLEAESITRNENNNITDINHEPVDE